MTLRQLLAQLSRSSAEAVRTLGNLTGNPVKDYLSIDTPIERDFHRCIEAANAPETVIFLCGSSGDGKSEILTKCYRKYEKKCQFHLDATHSFQPDMSAIQTLDQQFTDHKSKKQPIVVGINIGMLGNYAEEGAAEHKDIIESIQYFLNDKQDQLPAHHIFLNFEDYPKFEPKEDGVSADFLEELLVRITKKSDDNPFYQAWLEEKDQHPEILHSNYEMLQMLPVQEVIVDTLLKVRLKYDQFLTARTLLDFIFSALTGPNYLFDNIFTTTDTELTRALTHFDPCTLRSKAIDIFLIQQSMKVKDDEFNQYKETIKPVINEEHMTAGSWIRSFYLLQNHDFPHNYHERFKPSFTQELYQKYLYIWRLHDQYDGKNRDQRKDLRNFYQKDLLKAIFLFANRLAPELGQKQWYLAKYNGYCLSTLAEVRENLKAFSSNRSKRLSHFNAMLTLNKEPLEKPLQVSANFLELILKINSGYRPNKHDKNNIVILEEFIDQVTAQLRSSNTLKIHSSENQWMLTNNEEYDEITVEEAY